MPQDTTTRRRRMRSHIVLAVLLGSALTLALASLAALAPTAHAGTYTVHSCQLPNGAPAGTGAWTFVAKYPAASASYDSCPRGGLYAALRPGTAQAADAWARWHFTAPDATQIVRYRLWRSARVASGTYYYYGGAEWHGSPFEWAGPNCKGASGCGGLGDPSVPLSPANVLDRTPPTPVSQIALYISCGRSAGGEGCPAASPVAVETWLHRSEVTLADDVAPVLETAPTGALVADAGTVSGRAHVSLLATDRGGGLTRAHVEVDGRIVATQALGSAPCQEPYTARVPCPQRAATTIPVETASLPDGRHVVRVLVDDAAGNRTGSAPTPLVTVNAQPDPSCTLEPTVSGPLSLSAALVREKGTSKSKHKRKSRKHRRSKSRRRARARASRASTTTRLTAPRPSLKVNYASRKRVTLVGRLARPDGSAVGGAPVCIVARTDGSDGIPQPLARLTTAPDGTFATRVPRGPSRELWAIHRTGAGAIVARAVLNVVPRVTIRPSRRHLRNGQVLTIRGSVSGGPIPRRGVIVKAEAWRGTRWQAFGTTRARGEDGRFKIRYRFTGTRGRQRYTLRVQVAAQAAYPYVSGRSKRIHVYVRG